MNKNKFILNKCPNFYRIVNFDYFEDDFITDKLIKIYEDFIFRADITSYDEMRMVEKIDYVLGKYIDDYLFRKKMQQDLLEVKIKKTCTDVLHAIVESIIAIFGRYEEETTRNIYLSRWI